MKLSELISYIKIGHDIEFSYNDLKYSITSPAKDGVRFISFCEFYKEPADYNTIDEFLSSAKIEDELLVDILDLITDIDIY
jgi:hypothetical protein